jgi:hypothetical protein
VVLLALACLAVVVLTFPAPGPTSVDSLVTGLVRALPGLFGWFWEISYDLLIAWALVLIALALFAHGRKRLLFEELLAVALAVGFALVAGWLAGTDWSESFKAVAASGAPPIYLAVRLALATAVPVMASPYLARPFRCLGRWVVGLGGGGRDRAGDQPAHWDGGGLRRWDWIGRHRPPAVRITGGPPHP